MLGPQRAPGIRLCGKTMRCDRNMVTEGIVRKKCPPGSLAWQEYRVNLRSGRTITLAFSLADACNGTMATAKKRHAASHLGLLVILDDPESLEEAVLWLHRRSSLTLVSGSGDTIISDEVRALLPRYFTAFFDEVKELAPGLAEVKFVVPRTGDKSLH